MQHVSRLPFPSQRRAIPALGAVLLVALFYMYSDTDTLFTGGGSGNFVRSKLTCKKWIIVTTINKPTKAMEKLASFPDWCLLVVADQKTPADWHMPNVTFLSVDWQNKNRFRISRHVPWKNYGRKNIAYLYAIAHGAQFIYETDDDNEPKDTLNGAFLFEPTELLVYNTSEPAVNPYVHFGLDHAWPRGYPLSRIKKEHPNCFVKQKLLPAIQQGLADHDPDVDAIYRLSQPLPVYFDASQPTVVLPTRTGCPFNSQNTLFSYEALWALVLPVTVSIRVTDIWRSWWNQRLLWDIGQNLAFLPPSVVQFRNPHSYIKDFSEEVDLYLKTESLIDFLLNWKPAGKTLPDRLVELGRALAREEYWAEGDARLMEAWVEDLKSLGYKFPAIVPGGPGLKHKEERKVECLERRKKTKVTEDKGKKKETTVVSEVTKTEEAAKEVKVAKKTEEAKEKEKSV